MSSGEESGEKTRAVKSYPLNSKRFTAHVVHRIAAALGLPKAPLADARPMVEGSLSEGHEPQNVQVDLVGSESGTIIRLRDADGVFLDIPPGEPDGGNGSAERGTGDQEVEEESEMDTEVIEDDLRSRTGGAREETEAEEEELQVALDAAQERIAGLEMELEAATQQNIDLTEEVKVLSVKIREGGDKNRALWRLHCEKLAEYDEQITGKEEEIEALERRIAVSGAVAHEPPHALPEHSAFVCSPVVAETHEPEGARHRREPSVTGRSVAAARSLPAKELSRPAGRGTSTEFAGHSSVSSHVAGGGASEPRMGKAPPVDPFCGEVAGMTFDDWYPSLKRAAHWNQWTDEDTLIQLAGHLRGRALQEWTLLREAEKETLADAATSLRSRLDPGSRALVALDFRHAAQRQSENVADYISRLEQLFRRAHGREGISDETRDTLLHCQLQEGLRYEIMQAPAVSGSHTYPELCLAARNEERRIAELAKRRQYRRSGFFPEPRQQGGSKTERVPDQETGQRAGPCYDHYRGPQVLGPNYAYPSNRGHQPRGPYPSPRGPYPSDQGPPLDRGYQPRGPYPSPRGPYPSDQGPPLDRGPYPSDQGPPLDRGHQPRGPGPSPGRGRYTRGPALEPRRCFECNEVGHMRKDCPQLKESQTTSHGVNRQVTTLVQPCFQGEGNATALSAGTQGHLLPYLLSSDSEDDSGSGRPKLSGHGPMMQIAASEKLVLLQWNEENTHGHHQLSQDLSSSDLDDDPGVLQVRLTDRGSKPQYADVQVQGVPARGVIDTGSDITIMGGELFRHVAIVARLRKSQLRKPDKIPKTYDGRTFTLDGMMDLDLTFNGITMKVPVYIRASAIEQLLLREGVCRQLQVITYHPDVSDRKGRKWHPPMQMLPPTVVDNRSTGGASEKDSAAAEREHPNVGTTTKKGRSHKPRPGREDASQVMEKGRESAATTCGATGLPQGESSEAVGLRRARTVQATVVHGSTQTEDRQHAQQWPTHRSDPDAEVPKRVAGTTQTSPEVDDEEADMDGVVPTVRVRLLQTVRVPPRQSVFVKTTAETELPTAPLMFEPSDRTNQDGGVYGEECLLDPSDDGTFKVPLTNPTAITRIIPAGEVLGQVTAASVIRVAETETVVGRVLSARMDQQRKSAQEELRKEKLKEVIGELDLPQEEKEAFQSFLVKHHRAFCLEDGERRNRAHQHGNRHGRRPSEKTESAQATICFTPGGGAATERHARTGGRPTFQVTMG